ncbi:MAG: chemotaxis protein CheR [Segetibacter sp.]|nr:chemotaxis protein CheR [Segetibacter sp.]
MKTRQYIIAIGASAGGMDQINKFFDYTPLDGVSYIVIQHLSADYKSMMPSLLHKHSKLTIEEATNNMTVEVNKVYLIPSKNVMTISDGKLLLTDKVKGVNFTINTFFKSLAEERGNKAVGVILSGTGADGTDGMRAIKEAGGLLLASDPGSTEFNQMPLSIIETGLVDHVVTPQEMPKVIEVYVEREMAEKDSKSDEEEDEQVMRAITDLIKNKLPEDFSGYKKNTILRRIKRRASLKNTTSLESYLHLLKQDTDELQNLVKDFLIGVTSFFRDKEAFEIIEATILPQLIQAKQSEDIKIWIAGCASGEEAYSFAILVREQLDAVQKNNPVKIFATDIDDEALQLAGKGFYNQSIEKNVSTERLERFFTKDNKGYKIKTSIREMLIFAHHDLVKNPPYCNIDLISCRNVLIYMNATLQKKVMGMLHFGLRYKGYLVLGPSENINELGSSVEEIDKKWKIYQNKEAKRTMNFETFIAPHSIDSKAFIKPGKKMNNNSKERQAAGEEIDENLLAEMGYAGLTVNENNQVLDFFGDHRKFLLQKMFVHHLPDLLSKPLQIAYRVGTIEADKTNKLIVVKGISVESIDSPVSLYIKPLTTNEQGEAKRLVLFSAEDDIKKKQAIAFDDTFYTNKYTVNIEEELRVTKEKLKYTEDLLLASNENMQSFNEELLSANEEMQSTNEEMQSVNEELQTINAEYQTKIRELSELNDDLNNYFRSNLNSQIFVNKDLVLMKFSPPTIALINVLESDIGRPLSNISTNIRFETIDKDIKETLLNGGVITKEIQAIDGKWFQIMTMPYLRKGNNQTDGAIITFNDITELKRIQKELAESNENLKAINTDLDNFVYTASHDLLNPINNIEHLIYFISEKGHALDNETKEYVKMLSKSVGKFRAVLKEMAAIGQIESEMLKLETIDLNEMITEVLESIQWKISAEKAEIQTFLKAKNITFSKKNCRSMLYNLINNAIKFRSPDRNPEIELTTKDLTGYTFLSVKDNGIGIENNNIESIFKMYKKLNTHAEGQGLGLFLIKKMVDAAGGKVEVESEPGKGTEFRLFIKK